MTETILMFILLTGSLVKGKKLFKEEYKAIYGFPD